MKFNTSKDYTVTTDLLHCVPLPNHSLSGSATLNVGSRSSVHRRFCRIFVFIWEASEKKYIFSHLYERFYSMCIHRRPFLPPSVSPWHNIWLQWDWSQWELSSKCIVSSTADAHDRAIPMTGPVATSKTAKGFHVCLFTRMIKVVLHHGGGDLV